MIDTMLADFNTYVRQFGPRVFLVAGRCFDLAPDNFERLACLWYQKNGLLELPNDRYIGKLPNGQEAERFHSVDELLLSPPKELEGIGKHIFDGWQGEKIRLAKIRNADPIVIIAPPPQKPPQLPQDEPKKDSPYNPHPNMPTPPKAKPMPVELPPKSDEPKKKTETNWRLIGGIVSGIVGAGLLVAKMFAPGWVILILEIVQKIISAIGG